MSRHPGDIRIYLKTVCLTVYQNAEKDSPLHAVRVIRIEISGRAGDPDCDIGMQLLLYRPRHRLRALLRVDAVSLDHLRINADKNFCLIQIRHIPARKDRRCPLRIGDHRCKQSRGTALHRGDRGVSGDESFNEPGSICRFSII